jgi:hypothetical protein
MFFARGQRMRLAGPAAAGIIAAHWSAYALTLSSHERAHLLEDTGHRFFPYLAAIGLGLLVAALSGWIARCLDPTAARSTRVLGVAGRLASLQVIGFLGLELGERAFFGHGVSLGVLSEAPVIAGLILQLVFAAFAALLLAAVAKVVDLVVARRGPRRTRKHSPTWVLSQTTRPRMRLATGSWTLRGPPAV